jgi:hypothetical protein
MDTDMIDPRSRFSFHWWQVLALVALVGGIGFLVALAGRTHQDARQDADAAFLQSCGAAGGEGCGARLAAEGERCFRASYKPHSRYSPAFMDQARFDRCVQTGYDAWFAAHTAEMAQKRADERAFAQEVR